MIQSIKKALNRLNKLLPLHSYEPGLLRHFLFSPQMPGVSSHSLMSSQIKLSNDVLRYPLRHSWHLLLPNAVQPSQLWSQSWHVYEPWLFSQNWLLLQAFSFTRHSFTSSQSFSSSFIDQPSRHALHTSAPGPVHTLHDWWHSILELKLN